jgi:DNA-binding MarR family transcriptional regulator
VDDKLEPTPVSVEAVNEHVSEVCAVDDPSRAPGITLTGLVFETAGGLRRALAPGIESELGLGGLALEVLVRLERSPGTRLRMIDLAAQTGLTPGGLTRAIDRLANAGLVCREACPDDRRGAFAALTPLGRTRTNEALRRHERDIAALIAGVLNTDDTETLIALLRRLRDRVHPEAARVTGDSEAPKTVPPS